MIKSQLSIKYGTEPDQKMLNAYIFRTDYSFTKKTILTFGLQYTTHRDLLWTSLPYPNNYDKETFLLQLVNKSRYLKYDIALVCGISKQIYKNVVPAVSEIDTIDTFFFFVYIGG